MGFQIIHAKLDDMNPSIYIAIGSRLLLPARTLEELYATFQEINTSGANMVDDLKTIPSTFIQEPVVVASRLEREIGIQEIASHLLHPQPLVTTVNKSPVRAYFRYSAFPKDRRVLDNGDFVQDTYATTFNDIRMVPSGFAAVGRYALPNPLSARYVYIILTDTTPFLVGTTVPNYGQAGGGVEVYFKYGAKAFSGMPHEIPLS